MFSKIRNLHKDELIKGSSVLLLMIILFNFLNYIYQISMAKSLGAADYGILAALMSLIYIFSISNEALQTIVSKYTSGFNLKNQYGKMKFLVKKSLLKGFIFSLIIYLLLIPFSFIISSFWKINVFLILLTNLFIFYSFGISITRGVIQGRKKFFSLGGSLVFEGFFKVVISILLVIAGFKVYGAMGGILLSAVLTFFVALFSIKEIIKSKEEVSQFPKFYTSNIPILVAVTSIILMYTLDIFLVKGFFDSETAGIYSFVSLMAKSILFVSLAISKAMFPIASENFESGKSNNSVFKKSLIIVLLISIIALILFFFFPEKIISLLSLGSLQYVKASNILFILGLAFTFISLSNVIVTYRISINKSKTTYSLMFFVISEVILLTLFHASLMQFSVALLINSTIMFLYSLIFLRK